VADAGSLPEAIAVIGMSGRFPQCHNVGEFWDLLVSGRSAITRVPLDRWTATRPDEWGGFVPEMQAFDPLFFEISPRDAALMDPRQRLFLEEAWHTLEDAGYMGERIRGTRCGVYVGVEEGEYAGLGGDGQVTNNQNAMLPARIAYFLDLKGPNFALTAACSSGLVAVHQACQALRQGDCDLALAGGASLIMSPLMYTALGKLNLLSPDGHCYAFDQRANGMVIGEAVAAILLKPVAKAIADGDRIYGCIKANGVNYDGRTNGITVPDPSSQTELITQTYERYGIDPTRIQYVMAHSVGSPLGDPIEFQALHRAFRAYTDQQGFCTIGSIKPLIGHTTAASGVVGLIAMLLAMQHQTIPATQNFASPNTDITFESSPFVLHTANQVWHTPSHQPRLGAVSTTGISGTNAHVVIEEYVPTALEQPSVHLADAPRIVILSARTPERLQAVVHQMLQFLDRGDCSLADLAYTLQVGREAMESRVAMVVRDLDELASRLRHYLAHGWESRTMAANGQPIPIFTGTLAEERSEMAILLAGGLGDDLLHLLLAENNLEKLAMYWAKGGKIPWAALHADGPFRLLALPTYPFARERYWVQASATQQPAAEQRSQADDALPARGAEVHGATSRDPAGIASGHGGFSVQQEQSVSENMHRYLIWFLRQEAGVAPGQIDPGKRLQSYGLDSITSAKLMRGVEKLFQVRLTGRELLEHSTIASLVTYLAGKAEAINRYTCPAQPEPGDNTQGREDSMDARVIEALDQLERGMLDLEAVQRIIGD
jgi:polyketide synthase PksM